MIADRYLQPRRELETALSRLLQLGSETNRTTSWLEIVQGLLTPVRDPLLVVVIGDAKSGKSTLINALFDDALAAAGVESAADRIYLFQYGTEEKTVDVSERFREQYLPVSFLKEFKIVDTPGTNTIGAEDRQLIQDFIQHADLVLVVLSVVNPWTQGALDCLDSVDKAILNNTVFVLQQADLREAGGIDVIQRHLADTATQKIGFAPPMFAVSARDALLARSTGSDNDQRRMERQFGPLQEQINLVVAQSGGRTQKLRSACQIAQVLLHDISTELRTTLDVIGHDQARLTRAKTLLQTRKEQTLRHVADLLLQVERTAKQASAQGLPLLKEQLSVGQIWKTIGGQLPPQRDFQLQIDKASRESIERQIEETAQLLESDLRGIWPQLHDLIDQQFASNVKADVPEAPPDFARQRRELLQSIQMAMSARASGSNLEEELVRLFRTTSMWLRLPAAAALVCAVTALLVLKVSFAIAGFAAGLAALAVAIGVALAFYRRTRILRAYQQQTQRRVAELVEIISWQFNETIDSFHNQIAARFEPLAAHSGAQRERSEPLLQRADELQRMFVEAASRVR
jgi:GTPase SAR1 family protein